MLREVDKYLDEGTVQLDVKPGGRTADIRRRAADVLPGKTPECVVIHCGTNDVEKSSLNDVKREFNGLIHDVLFCTEGTKIILSGIIRRSDKPELNERIDMVNTFLKSLQTETVTFVDHNPTLGYLRNMLQAGGLHLRQKGLRKIAANLNLSLKGQVCVAPHTPRTPELGADGWPVRKQQLPDQGKQQQEQQKQRQKTNTKVSAPSPTPVPVRNRFTKLAGGQPAENNQTAGQSRPEVRKSAASHKQKGKNPHKQRKPSNSQAPGDTTNTDVKSIVAATLKLLEAKKCKDDQRPTEEGKPHQYGHQGYPSPYTPPYQGRYTFPYQCNPPYQHQPSTMYGQP